MQIALEERTTGHASYANIERVLEILQEIDTTNVSTRGIEMLERIRTTFDYLKDTLDKVDPWLVSTNTMDNINSPISPILTELTNFNSDKNEQRLNNIFIQLETLILYFSQLAVSRTPEDIESVRQSVIKFRLSVGQHLGHVERDLTDTSTALRNNTEKLNELTGSIESQKSRIDTIVSEFQSQFLQTQTSRNEQFHTLIKESEVDFTDTLETYENKFKQQIIDQTDQFKALTDDFMTKAQIELEQINVMNKEAEKIVGIISMKGLAHGYQKIANDEGNKAFWWNLGSIASMIGVIVFGVIFLLMHEGAFDWTTLISRIVLTGIGLTLFTYCAKQATNHRNEERRNRKIELELASLDPYLKDLEPEKQKEVKQTLVNKYFGVELSNALVQQAPVQQQNIIESITNNPQFIQSLIEKMSQSTPK